MKKESKMNRLSYFLTMLFALPILVVGNVVARSDEPIVGLARLTSLVLFSLVIVWSIQRLHNAGKSAWWVLLILPPATILLLAYTFFAPSSQEHVGKGVSIYGIRARGFWKITAIVAISLAALYLTALYTTFLTDGL